MNCTDSECPKAHNVIRGTVELAFVFTFLCLQLITLSVSFCFKFTNNAFILFPDFCAKCQILETHLLSHDVRNGHMRCNPTFPECDPTSLWHFVDSSWRNFIKSFSYKFNIEGQKFRAYSHL